MNSIVAASLSQGPQKQKDIDRNAVRQALNNPLAADRPLMIVEGDDDVEFYKVCMSSVDWRFKGVHGCEVVIEFLNEFVPNYGTKICGVIDSDYRRLNSDKVTFEPLVLAPNLYVTDMHDWENWMVNDQVIEDFWNDRMNPDKYTMPDGILATVKTGIKNLSFLKWYHSRRKYEAETANEEKKEGYNFKHCTMELCFDQPLAECLNVLVTTQKSMDDKLLLEDSEMQSFVDANPSPDEEQFFVGHDLCDGVVFVMKKWGKPKPQITNKCFPRFLIDHGSTQSFERSRLMADLLIFLESFKANHLAGRVPES